MRGGQQGDKGTIHSANGEFKVEETIHLQGGKIGHVGVMTKGMLSIGETVTLSVCPKNRALTSKNHSATHLLQKALRTVLGSHVEQAGSYVLREGTIVLNGASNTLDALTLEGGGLTINGNAEVGTRCV